MVFDVTIEGNLVEGKMRLIPEFLAVIQKRTLGHPRMKYIAMVYDFDTPYRMPEKQRKEVVIYDLWGKENKIDPEKDPLVIAAIEKYQEIQYDPLRESYHVMNETIHSINQTIYNKQKDGEVDSTTVNMMLKLEQVIEKRDLIKDKILRSERSGEENQLKGGAKLSWLEKK